MTPYLDPDETIEVAAFGLVDAFPWKRVLFVIGVLVVINAVLLLQELELRSWVIGGSIGITVGAAYLRGARWVALTNHRILFFGAHPIRPRPTRFLESHARSAVDVAEGRAAVWGSRSMTYRRPTGGTFTVTFPRPFSSRAHRIMSSLRDRGGGLPVTLPPPPPSGDSSRDQPTLC